VFLERNASMKNQKSIEPKSKVTRTGISACLATWKASSDKMGFG